MSNLQAELRETVQGGEGSQGSINAWHASATIQVEAPASKHIRPWLEYLLSNICTVAGASIHSVTLNTHADWSTVDEGVLQMSFDAI